MSPEPPAHERPVHHPRWARTEESGDFFIDEDGLRLGFWLLLAGSAAMLGTFAAGLWRLRRAALAPPPIVGISHGLVFSATPEGLASVREADFDLELADTVEVLFGRTERGLPPEISQFCAPEAVAAVAQAYHGAGAQYPAGFAQTLSLLESRTIEQKPGRRRVFYRGLLSSRSLEAAQTSPIYLDCTFAMGPPAPLNAAGWRLLRVAALGREDFYRPEREAAARAALGLAPQ
ncbi:MAG TPA: hypothetical protein VHV47_05995 [Opitutaceae bacterium]|jgi:hypothetical protein|nr:hypothetical protein [Opitutaceae bacterium]